MADSERILHKKLQRRDNTSRKRQATFISEYVYVKYFTIYEEAAQAFNQLNAIHPRKPDLRTSMEFKNWKRQLKGQPKLRQHKKRDPTQNIFYEDIPSYRIINNDDVYEDGNVTIDIQNIPKKVMQLKIPLLSFHVVDEGETSNHQESGEPNVDQIIQEVIDEGDQESGEPNVDQIIEEVINEGEANKDDLVAVQPSFFDDLSQETLDEMFSQLRSDPHLASIMDDFNLDMDLDIGMDIEIDDRLEKELNDILC